LLLYQQRRRRRRRRQQQQQQQQQQQRPQQYRSRLAAGRQFCNVPALATQLLLAVRCSMGDLNSANCRLTRADAACDMGIGAHSFWQHHHVLPQPWPAPLRAMPSMTCLRWLMSRSQVQEGLRRQHPHSRGKTINILAAAA
jgi:hypothetical protein